MDLLITDGQRLFAIVILSGLLIIDVIWEAFRRNR
jgi:hypothetical protein